MAVTDKHDRSTNLPTAMRGRGPKIWFVIALLATAQWAAVRADEVRVAAAASLNHALTDIASHYERASGHRVRLSFGSSGNLARQIAQGAPFDVFFSANADYVAMLVNRALTNGDALVYGVGRLVLYAPPGSPIDPGAGLRTLAAGAHASGPRNLAIANPRHAPYGVAAREALIAEGVWPQVESRLVIGENVAQAAQFAASGSVDAALIAFSIVRSPGFADGRYALVPSNLHARLTQTVVVLKGAGDAAFALIRFLGEDQAAEILMHYGFELPRRGLHGRGGLGDRWDAPGVFQ